MEDKKPEKKKKLRRRPPPPPHVGREADRIKTVSEAQAIVDEVESQRREFIEPPDDLGEEVFDMGRPRSSRVRESIPNGDRVHIDEVKLDDGDVKLISDGNVEGTKFRESLQMDAFIAYMLTGRSWRQAAADAGIHIKVASRWLRKKTVKKRMAKFRDVLAEASLTRIATLTNAAVTAMEDAMDPDNHIQFRLQGAKMIFDSFTKLNQIVGMEQRLRDIEESLGVAGTVLPHHANATNTAAMTAAALENINTLGLGLPGDDDGIQRPVDSEADLAR